MCVWDDFSSDGTIEWLNEIGEHSHEEDFTLKFRRNDGPSRLGHTILYNRIVEELATSDLCMIWHSDMYLCPGALDAIKHLMYQKVDADTNPQEPYIPLMLTHPDGTEFPLD